MFLDARSVPTGTVIETEVCIVGAGAAGITLAREFTNVRLPRYPARKRRYRAGEGDAGTVRRQQYRAALLRSEGHCLRLRYLRRHDEPLGLGGALSRIRSTSKCVRASRILAGHSRWHIWSRGTGARKQSCKLGPSGYALSDWGIATSRYSPAVQRPAFHLPSYAAKPTNTIWPGL